jgi:hypothetical protein
MPTFQPNMLVISDLQYCLSWSDWLEYRANSYDPICNAGDLIHTLSQ